MQHVNLLKYLETIFSVEREDIFSQSSFVYSLKGNDKSTKILVIQGARGDNNNVLINLIKGVPYENSGKQFSLFLSDIYREDINKIFVTVPHTDKEDLVFPIASKLFRKKLPELLVLQPVRSHVTDLVFQCDISIPIDTLDSFSLDRSFSILRNFCG